MKDQRVRRGAGLFFVGTVDVPGAQRTAMLVPLERQVFEYAKTHEMFLAADPVLLAVSGGGDSTALLHILAALRSDGRLGSSLVCAHVNHELRGDDSDADEAFVKARATDLGLPAVAERIDVGDYAHKNRLSVETAGRQCRMAVLGQLARANGCATIATGHQKNDNAETILDRISRGTAYRGLGGIRPVRELDGGLRIVRPLLCVTRDQIAAYLRQRGLRWREDRTNRDCVHRRNFIRHRLLPALQAECEEDIVGHLCGLAESAGALYERVSWAADEAWRDLVEAAAEKVVVSASGLRALPTIVKIELVRRALVRIGCGERNLSQGHYQEVLRLAEEGSRFGSLSLPGDCRAALENGALAFAPSGMEPATSQSPSEESQIDVPGRAEFGGYVIETQVIEGPEAVAERRSIRRTADMSKTVGRAEFTERFDLERVELPILVRRRRDGDRFRPLGMPGDKKVGKFLTGAGVPAERRNRVVIICDQTKILWVCPIRMSEQAKVTDRTDKVLRIRVRRG